MPKGVGNELSKDEVKKIIVKWLQGWFQEDDLVVMYEKTLGEKYTYKKKERSSAAKRLELAHAIVLNCNPPQLLRTREMSVDRLQGLFAMLGVDVPKTKGEMQKYLETVWPRPQVAGRFGGSGIVRVCAGKTLAASSGLKSKGWYGQSQSLQALGVWKNRGKALGVWKAPVEAPAPGRGKKANLKAPAPGPATKPTGGASSSSSAAPAKTGKPAKTITKAPTGVKAPTIAVLKQKLRSLGQKTTGNKEDLVARLAAAPVPEPAPAPEAEVDEEKQADDALPCPAQGASSSQASVAPRQVKFAVTGPNAVAPSATSFVLQVWAVAHSMFSEFRAELEMMQVSGERQLASRYNFLRGDVAKLVVQVRCEGCTVSPERNEVIWSFDDDGIITSAHTVEVGEGALRPLRLDSTKRGYRCSAIVLAQGEERAKGVPRQEQVFSVDFDVPVTSDASSGRPDVCVMRSSSASSADAGLPRELLILPCSPAVAPLENVGAEAIQVALACSWVLLALPPSCCSSHAISNGRSTCWTAY